MVSLCQPLSLQWIANGMLGLPKVTLMNGCECRQVLLPVIRTSRLLSGFLSITCFMLNSLSFKCVNELLATLETGQSCFCCGETSQFSVCAKVFDPPGWMKTQRALSSTPGFFHLVLGGDWSCAQRLHQSLKKRPANSFLLMRNEKTGLRRAKRTS